MSWYQAASGRRRGRSRPRRARRPAPGRRPGVRGRGTGGAARSTRRRRRPLGARGGGVAGQRRPRLEADRSSAHGESGTGHRHPDDVPLPCGRDSASAPSGLYPDPAGLPGTRWWDGQGWTEHVEQAAPPPPAPVQSAPQGSGPSLYDQPVLLVNQKTKLIELTNEYAVLDGEGQPDRRRRPGGAERREKGGPAVQPARPVPHPRPRGARRPRAGAGADPAGEADEVTGPRWPGPTAARSARSCRPTCSGRSASTWSPAVRSSVYPGRELAGLGLRDHRRGRHGGRPDHEEVGGPGADVVHHGRLATSSSCTSGCPSRWPAWSSPPP